MGSSSVVELPLLPLRDVVVYPHMVLPLFVGREQSIEALEDAMANDKQVLLVAQRNPAVNNPAVDGIYQVGTVSNILQLLKLPDGTIKVLVEGSYRAAVENVDDKGLFLLRVSEKLLRDIPERGGIATSLHYFPVRKIRKSEQKGTRRGTNFPPQALMSRGDWQIRLRPT